MRVIFPMAESDADHDEMMHALQAEANRLCNDMGLAAIQISASFQSSDGSWISLHAGTGCWHTRYGLLKEWLIRADEDQRLKARRFLE